MRTNPCYSPIERCKSPPAGAFACRTAKKTAGITFVEMLVYLGMLTVISALAFGIFNKYWDQTKLLTRHAEDITKALQAGETWRADVRQACGPLTVEAGPAATRLHIPRVDGEVVFLFESGEVWRYQTNSSTEREILLIKAKRSEFIAESNRHAISWRWELELPARQKKVKMQPLFSFEAAPGGKADQ